MDETNPLNELISLKLRIVKYFDSTASNLFIYNLDKLNNCSFRNSKSIRQNKFFFM